MLWYSLEAPRRGTSNEYPQHMFSSRNKKNTDTFCLKTHLIKSYVLNFLNSDTQLWVRSFVVLVFLLIKEFQ